MVVLVIIRVFLSLGIFITFIFALASDLLASTFTIAVEKEIIDDREPFITVASISGLKKSTQYFLEIALTRSIDNPRYFGLTQNSGGGWFPYDGSPSEDAVKNFFSFTTDEQGNSEQRVVGKADINDSDYKGPGQYALKLKRLTQGGTGYWSDNSLTISLLGPTTTPTPLPTSLPSATPKPTLLPKPTITSKPLLSPTATKARDNPTIQVISPLSTKKEAKMDESAQDKNLLTTLTVDKSATIAGMFTKENSMNEAVEASHQSSNIQRKSFLPGAFLTTGGAFFCLAAYIFRRRFLS